MAIKKGFLHRLNNKKWFILALILTLLALWGVFTYLGMAQKPMESIDASPARSDSEWHYTLADGTELVPDKKGVFTLTDGSNTLFCTLSLDKYADRLTPSALIGLNSRTCNVAILADGKLIADPSHCFDMALGNFADSKVPGGSGIFSLGNIKELTLAVRFLTPEASINGLPAITIYPEQYAYTSPYLTEGARAALPAGVFLAISVALSLLFLFGLYNKKGNADVLLLSLVSLSFCLLETIPFGLYVVSFLQTPFVTYTLRLLPTLMLLWILWYHCRGKLRTFGWLYPLLWTLATAAGIVWRQIDIVKGNGYTNLLQGKLLPLAMLTALLVCVWQAVRKNNYYRRFFGIGGCLAVFAGLISLISYSVGGKWWAAMQAAFQNTALLGYFEPLQLLNQFLVFLLFFAAIFDFVTQIVHRNAELQALTMQNKYTAEHASQLSRSLDETLEMRHEMKHHITALKVLCESGDAGRIKEYVNTLADDFRVEPSRYTDHTIINAIVASCAQRARVLGAEFEASVQVPQAIKIEDADIAVVLSNMIDNALEALSSVQDESNRRLHLKIAIFEETGLFISCINTFAGELKRDKSGAFLSTKTEAGHGIGLKAMRRVAEKYNSILLPEVEGNTFHIKTYLYFKK